MADDVIMLKRETYNRIMHVIESIEKGDFIRVSDASPITITELGPNGEVTLSLDTITCPA